MKKIVAFMLLLAVASTASAALVPEGVTGLWRFQDSPNKLKATVGVDLVSSHPDNSGWFSGPWTVIEPGMSDGGIVQDRSWDHLTCYHGIPGPNGGRSYINEYTIAIDYRGDKGWNSLYQTAWNGNANDGDLWIDATTHNSATIGVGGIEGVGYSTQTFDATGWHRFVLSVDNGNFFRAYVDGNLLLDAPGRNIDGRFSLELDRFNLFADDSWEDVWGMVGTVAVWGRALTTEEIAPMGGWLNGSATPTPLTVPEPASVLLMASAAIGGLVFFIRRKRK